MMEIRSYICQVSNWYNSLGCVCGIWTQYLCRKRLSLFQLSINLSIYLYLYSWYRMDIAIVYIYNRLLLLIIIIINNNILLLILFLLIIIIKKHFWPLSTFLSSSTYEWIVVCLWLPLCVCGCRYFFQHAGLALLQAPLSKKKKKKKPQQTTCTHIHRHTEMGRGHSSHYHNKLACFWRYTCSEQTRAWWG